MPAPQGRDLELTRRSLLSWLRTRLPEAQDLRVSGLTGPGATGFSSDTLMFDLAWRQDSDEWRKELVVRIEPTGFRVFPHYDVRRQFRIQRQLWKSKVPVVRMLWHEEDPTVLGAPFYVMHRAAGRIPTDNPPYHVDGWLTEVTPEERESIWWSGLEAMTTIHQLDWRERLRLLAEEADAGPPLERQLADYQRYLRWAAQGRPQPTCEAALSWLRAEQPRDEPAALCWGDARIGNMVFDGGRCVAVLDWEMATVANPEQDLGWWIFLDHHHSIGCGVPRLAGFPDREATIARWAELTGREPRHVSYYEVFAAFRFSVIMIRVAQQLVASGLLPEDSAFETDNTATRLLASMLELPPPAG
jgi:aminoglycoside phosphotransferase (APT) family kinase protein